MFAYCGNNPASFSDSRGTSPLDDHPINENPYVVGGYSNKGFSVGFSTDFLDPYYCLEYAFAIVQVYGNGYSYREMDAERIAMEIYSHAKAYETGLTLSSLEDAPSDYSMYTDTSLPSAFLPSAPFKAAGAILIERAKDIYVNNDESIIMCFSYSLIWYHDINRNKVEQIFRKHHPFPNYYSSVIRVNSQERLSIK